MTETWADVLARAAMTSDHPGDWQRLERLASLLEQITPEMVALAPAGAKACLGDDYHIASALGDEDDSPARETRLADRYKALGALLSALSTAPTTEDQ